MPINVINVSPEKPETFTFDTMKVGTLYKLAEGTYSTLYVKTLQNTLVWFKPPTIEGESRIGDYKEACSRTIKFVRAPQGTRVVIEN